MADATGGDVARGGAMRRAGASLWPAGLMGRVIVVLLAALVLEFVGSSVLYDEFAALVPDGSTLEEAAGRLDVARRVLDTVPPRERDAVARELSGDGLDLAWWPDHDPSPEAGTQADIPAGRLLAVRPVLRDHGLQVRRKQPGNVPGTVSGSLGLNDGTRLRFVVADSSRVAPVLFEVLLSTAILAVCVLSAAALVVRTLSAPLRQLAQVADLIGRGPPVAVQDRGPSEVRRVARTLNAMQARMARLLTEQTEVLAAVSHDLRTPIARLRLRAGFLDDPAVSTAIEDDLAEMEAMVDAVLAFLGGEADPEPRRPLDIAALAATLADEAHDAGQDVAYAGPGRAVLQARPLEMRRAIGNLIGNAVKYAGSARVEVVAPGLREPGAPLRVRVVDPGPGIPEDQLLSVLEPFHRVESSRNANTGGIGLGLAIVRRAVERDGGRVVLANLPGGGFRAELVLPVAPG